MSRLMTPGGRLAPRAASQKANRRMRRGGLGAALADLNGGLALWRCWWVLAVNDVRQRYRRSRVGQFWLTISMSATIAGMALVFSSVLHQPLSDYLPFLAVGIIVWTMLASTINELAACFIGNELYLKSYATPRSAPIFRAIVSNLIISAHNFILIPLLWLTIAPAPSWSTLLFFPALLLVVFNMGWIGLIIGPLCTRFRDVGQIIQNAMQLMFFLTPIIYRPSQTEGYMKWIAGWNPFAHAVEILRGPLLGETPAAHHWAVVAALGVCGYAIAVPFYARYRARIIYWL